MYIINRSKNQEKQFDYFILSRNGYDRLQKRVCLVFTTIAITLIISIVAILLIPVMKNAMNVTIYTVITATTEMSVMMTTTQVKGIDFFNFQFSCIVDYAEKNLDKLRSEISN